MKKLFKRLFLILPGLFCCLFLAELAFAQQDNGKEETFKEKAPRVYIDCYQCDMDYIKTEITFVNFVRDRKEADVHVLVTVQRTGSGGREYTLAFIGQNDYIKIQNTLKYISYQTDTEDQERRGFVRILKMGLVPYAANSPAADYLNVIFEKKVSPATVKDNWNFWVFNLGLNGNISGEKTRSFIALHGQISANRVTPASKLRAGLSMSFNESNFEIEDETISSSSESRSFSGLYVVSLDDHWSAGSWLGLSSSTYNNVDLSLNPAPAIEYNFFPYAESTRKQLRVLYRVGYNYVRYREETIYEKTRDNLFGQTLSLTLEIKEPWGNIHSSLQGSHYFHDFSKNRLELRGGVSLQLFKGLELNVNGHYSQIHDQLSLRKAGARLEEILLLRKELATNYNYGMSIGLSYTFGSIYSAVVNPRFGR